MYDVNEGCLGQLIDALNFLANDINVAAETPVTLRSHHHPASRAHFFLASPCPNTFQWHVTIQLAPGRRTVTA